MQNHNHTEDRGYLLGHAAALSRRGSGREENQDSYSVEDHIWILADGMGGHEGGRTASAVAVASAALATQPGDSDLVDAVESCHYHLLVVGELTEQPTMGSTIVLAVRDPESGAVRIAWCGDSRAYLLVDGALSRLTTDHNLAQEEVAAGRITADEAFDHPGQAILLSALGCGSSEPPEIGQVEIGGTGRLLLCSDGLTSGLRDEQIPELLDGEDLEDVPLRLVDAAVAAGSDDDTSVVVVDLEPDVTPISLVLPTMGGVVEHSEQVWVSEYDYPGRVVNITRADSKSNRGLRRSEVLSDPDGGFVVFVESSGREQSTAGSEVPLKVVIRLDEDGYLLASHPDFEELAVGPPTLWPYCYTRCEHWMWRSTRPLWVREPRPWVDAQERPDPSEPSERLAPARRDLGRALEKAREDRRRAQDEAAGESDPATRE